MTEPVKMFIGIEVPADISALLQGFRDAHAVSLERVQWTETSNLHITLRFIGSQTEETARPIVRGLSRIFAPPVDITLSNSAVFEDVGVLVVDIVPVVGLMELQSAIDQIALSNGVAPAQYTYRPHISIARLKGAPGEYTSSGKLFKQAAVELGQFCSRLPRKHFRSTEMALFTSIGGRYKILQNFDFGRPL